MCADLLLEFDYFFECDELLIYRLAEYFGSEWNRVSLYELVFPPATGGSD